MPLRKLFLAAALLLTTVAAQAEQVIDIGYQRSSTLWILLKNDGQLEQRLKPLGFTVNWHEFSSGLLSAMNAGSVDLHADVADAFALFTQAANTPLTYYARENPSPSAQAIIVQDASPIRTVADLKGKRVAVSKGSGSNFLLISALKKAGLTLADITPVYLEAPDGVAAFSSGNVDAWAIWDPFLATQQREHHVRVIADGKDGIANYNRFYVANTRFAKAHPDVLQVVFDTLRDTGQWVKGHPQEAAKKLAPLWGNIPPETVELANSRRSYDIVPVKVDQLAEQQRIADYYYEAKLIPKPLTISDIAVWTPQAH
ncbi:MULTISPECIES: aliphatic sulfonate ABC transporter substrate-binding protein [unclassified Pseudomonas]|uniref:aliphatic sulfonate ABC transporter substrate-binding protein n=1 Tax=unclassified Pseudomonas TaxID=196821 RepID=UPI000D3C1D22|nr:MULTISPECIES: aliphatic sulfonate ABC transporter substrate-binding protein [unclassified Pseudomonas]RAU43402.1 aliphatic sulfonate ABC transporter substrate-binding protein [Pseudomonas sp. RIT 409]RAU50061.1 aliphatic sulfonate ABC transporter substrate-binding protein [Pseudomonas sp. RIT 412]